MKTIYKKLAAHWLGVVVAVLLLAAVGIAMSIFQTSRPPQTGVVMRNVPGGTVLFATHWGREGTAVETLHSLRRLAESQGIRVVSDDVVFVYLTDGSRNPDGFLTEVQLRVDPGALNMSDKLRKADCPGVGVKKVPDYMAAQIAKPRGVYDPASLYKQAYEAIAKQGLKPVGPPAEMFPSAGKISDGAKYGDIQSVIMVPADR